MTPVLHIVDSLDLGGYERAAVNLANAMPPESHPAHICATRAGGPLEAALAPHVGLLRLGRRRTFDAAALRRLAAFIRERGIRILHPHGPSLFLARAAALFAPHAALVWHAHAGRMAAEDRRALPYRLALRGAGGVIAVNEPLLEWARRRLAVPRARSWYLPNMAAPASGAAPARGLPGISGRRVLAVGNLRPEKDHATLLRAFAMAARRVPDAHLLIAGAPGDPAYEQLLHATVDDLALRGKVTFLGRRADASALMPACDIGVLSSRFEGLPMALLEYGMAGLPVAATSAGQCGEVLDGGRAGILAAPGDAAALGEALVALLRSPELRGSLGDRLRRRVEALYSAGAVIGRLCTIYDAVLAGRGRPARYSPPAGATVGDRVP